MDTNINSIAIAIYINIIYVLYIDFKDILLLNKHEYKEVDMLMTIIRSVHI